MSDLLDEFRKAKLDAPVSRRYILNGILGVSAVAAFRSSSNRSLIVVLLLLAGVTSFDLVTPPGAVWDRIGNSSPIHFDIIPPEPTLVNYPFVLNPTNHQLQFKCRLCLVFAEF